MMVLEAELVSLSVKGGKCRHRSQRCCSSCLDRCCKKQQTPDAELVSVLVSVSFLWLVKEVLQLLQCLLHLNEQEIPCYQYFSKSSLIESKSSSVPCCISKCACFFPCNSITI